jgi:hypothetical protein
MICDLICSLMVSPDPKGSALFPSGPRSGFFGESHVIVMWMNGLPDINREAGDSLAGSLIYCDLLSHFLFTCVRHDFSALLYWTRSTVFDFRCLRRHCRECGQRNRRGSNHGMDSLGHRSASPVLLAWSRRVAPTACRGAQLRHDASSALLFFRDGAGVEQHGFKIEAFLLDDLRIDADLHQLLAVSSTTDSRYRVPSAAAWGREKNSWDAGTRLSDRTTAWSVHATEKYVAVVGCRLGNLGTLGFTGCLRWEDTQCVIMDWLSRRGRLNH